MTLRSAMARLAVALVVILSCLIGYSDAADISAFLIPYDTGSGVSKCGSRYRDTSNYDCASCPTNQETDPDTQGGDGQYQGCRCIKGYATVENDCSGVSSYHLKKTRFFCSSSFFCTSEQDSSGTCVSKSCTRCATSGMAAYSDRSACVPCGNSTGGLSSTTRDCRCGAQQIIVERGINGAYLAAKECAACGAGSALITSSGYIAGKYYSADSTVCQFCPDDKMSMVVTSRSVTCECDSSYTLVGISGIGEQSCVLTTLTNTHKNDVTAATRVTYYDTAAAGTITSLTFEHYYLKAVSKCLYMGTPDDVVYCHQLANLCVLQLYDRNSQACIDHLSIVTLRGASLTNSITNWVTGMPWLYFGGTDANKVCNTFAYKKRVTLNDLFVRYVLAAYYMNGTFAGYQNLGSQMSYCGRDAPYSNRGGGDARSTEWLIFGTNEKSSFSCALDSLLEKEQMFYEMYIYRKDLTYTPVPVRITNIARTTTDLVNQKLPTVPLCDVDDVLTRRFFLFDIVSGVTKVSSANVPTVEVIRYASYISIEASLVTDKFARIYAPVVTITYKEVKPAAWKQFPRDRIDFSMYYTMNMDEFFTNFRIFFIIIMVCTGLLFALRYRNWQVRNSRVVTSAVLTTDLGGFNVSTIMELCLIASNTWVLVFFPVTVCIAWYFFTFYKIQTAPSVLLPPDYNIYSTTSPYYLFIVNIHVMAFFQLWYVLVMIYRQCRADLFFIDWEPVPTKQAAAAAAATNTTKSTVSVWRTILVANEWTELQCVRKTDIRFTLFFMGFILLGASEEFNATQQPALEDKSAGHRNIVLRFANTCFYWLLLSYGQYAWKFFIAERFLGEPPERLFVDFCTIAKISVIVLDEKYHGYYLHCRSPHQFADGTMTELVSMLHKEEAGLTVDRSLEGAPADVQSFQIFMSGEWREAFDKIRDNLVGAESVSEVMNDNRNRAMSRASAKRGASSAMRGRSSGSGLNSGQSLNNLPSEKVMKAWKEMLVFLQEFVENNFGKAALRRVVREPTYYEKMTNGGPELSVPEQPSVFYTDRDYNYCKVWLLGRELEMLTLNILAYSLFDIWFGSTCTSILLTYLLELGVCFIRHYLGQAMISRKTLIDNRFLI